MKTISVAISLFLIILTISIFPLSYPGNPVSAQSGLSITLYDNDARNFSNPPDVLAYANTEHTASPSEFVITAGGSLWRYNQWISVSDADGWIEARTTVATTSMGVQFWGDDNDGWATVYIDGVEIWTGDTRGSDNQYPGGAFVKYLQVSGLSNSTHTLRVESDLGQDVTMYFFGLGEVTDSGVVTGNRMVAYYPFDGDYQDHSGSDNHGTPKGNMMFASGKFGQGASFDGASLIEVSDSNSLDLYDGLTFSVWLYKENAGTGGWSVILSKGETSALDNSSPYALAHTEDGKYLYLRLAQNNAYHDLMGTSEIDFQSWHLVTVTWDGATVKFYVDGALKDSFSWNTPLTNSNAKLLIGNDPPGFNEHFRGIMDDLRIYNYALSQNEVNNLSSPTTAPGGTSTPGTTPVPSDTDCDIAGTWQWINGDTVTIHSNGTMESARGVSGTWRSINSDTYELEWSNGFTDTLTISADCNSLGGHNQYGGSVSATRISDGDTGTGEPGTSVPEPTSTTTSPPTSTSSGDAPVAGLVAYYPFDGDYQDYSGNGNHGTPKENMSFTTGSIGQGARFDGSSFIEVNDSDSLDLYDGFTFSLKLYKEDTGTGGWAVIFAKGDTSALDNSAPYSLAHTIDGLHPLVRLTKNNAYQTFSPTAQTGFGKWHHLAVTWDGTTIKFYIDGVDRGTYTWEGPFPNSTSKLMIGSDPPGDTEYFRGIMDDFRIYNHALSQSEIVALSTATTTQTIPSTGTGVAPSQPTSGAPTAPSIPTPAPAGIPTLTFESRSKAQGSSVQIPLTLSGVQEPIGNMDLTLSYDTSVLQATEAIKGSLTQNAIFDSNILDGKILISLAHNQGFSGDGSVAYIRFNVIGAEDSWSRLGIDDLSANRASDLASMNIETVDGLFTVLSTEEAKALTDCDGDGKVSVVDALCALQMAVGKKAEELSMDINNDGKITSLDARQILQMAVASGAIDTSYPGALAELETELETCENCVDAEIEVFDTNSDGTDDKWRYSLIESEVEEGLFAQETLELQQTNAGMQGTIIATLENRGDIDYLDYEYLIEIPKSFAETVDDLELPDTFEVTDPDPAGKVKADCPKGSKVSWNFKAKNPVQNYGQAINDVIEKWQKKHHPDQYYIPPECMGKTSYKAILECTFEVSKRNDLTECYKITDQELKDWCLYWMARGRGQSYICNDIVDSQIADKCRRGELPELPSLLPPDPGVPGDPGSGGSVM